MKHVNIFPLVWSACATKTANCSQLMKYCSSIITLCHGLKYKWNLCALTAVCIICVCFPNRLFQSNVLALSYQTPMKKPLLSISEGYLLQTSWIFCSPLCGEELTASWHSPPWKCLTAKPKTTSRQALSNFESTVSVQPHLERVWCVCFLRGIKIYKNKEE